jgi:hypothetical protein
MVFNREQSLSQQDTALGAITIRFSAFACLGRFGISVGFVRHFAGKQTVLGVCLGRQAISLGV